MARRKFKRSGTTHRRRASTKTSRRRRRVGATALNFSASSPLLKYGSALLGFFKPDILPLQKIVGDKVDGKIVAIGEAGLGFLLSQRKKKGKGIMSTATTAVAWYMIGAGVKKSLQEFGIMTGIGPYGRVPVIGRRIAGPYGRVPVIGRYTPNQAMNGYSPSGTMGKGVMCGVDQGKSGYTSSDKGSGYMN